MSSRCADSSQGDGSIPPAPPAPPDQSRSRAGNVVFKSGPLFLSSKGIGWTSWKKRWFILTRTSLVFFRSDPNAIPQKGSEVNLTLGGIDLNNSGSVVVKEDKKLLTVLFPDGRDGRAFTLKAETLEDLHEWKTALENALAQAPSAALVVGQNGIFRNDQADVIDGSLEQHLKDKLPVKSLVIGRPILLALEDIDGTPSFLEKALRFIEEHGVKVEGILRQAADVDDVEHRVREYEQGKTEFSAEEDPHIVADCVKYVLRELPSSPVPASCCNALLEACRADRSIRVTAMRAAICETFPEPNRRLLQRILTMMQTVASHKAVNRMSSSAVAACMAPLLLRPLLAGDCELENDFDVGGDGSVQLLQAAAAANHAQAIVITLLEEYNNIFGEASVSADLYSDSEESGSESEDPTDDDDDNDESYEDDEDDEHDDETDDLEDYTDDLEHAPGRTCSESGDSGDSDLYDNKSLEGSSSSSKSPEVGHHFEAIQKSSSSSPKTSLPKHDNVKGRETSPNKSNSTSVQSKKSGELQEDLLAETSSVYKLAGPSPSTCIKKSTSISNAPAHSVRRPTVWGRTSARKNLSMESIDYALEDEAEIQRLEDAKTDLQNRITEEAKRNIVLQESLEIRKKTLHKRRLSLERDVARLQEQLQRERELRMALESGLKMPRWLSSVSATIDEKTKADLKEVAQAEADVMNLKQKFEDLELQLNQQREQNHGYAHESCDWPQQSSNNHGRQRHKQKDIDTTVNLLERSTRNKEFYSDGADSENEWRQDLPNFSTKHPPHNQQLESLRSSSSKFSGASTSSASEPVAARPPTTTNSKKYGTKNEGANSTTSALSKLTTRLNFLKERRTQIANELQNMDKGRGSGRGPSEPHQSHSNMDKCQGLECPLNLNLEKGRGIDASHSLQNLDNSVETESQPIQTQEKFRKSDTQPVKNQERGRRPDGPNVQSLERGRSEGQSFWNVERSRGSEGQSYIPPRTNSR
ncbi:rho GTPase-activating protein REN1 isoform X2 [Malania oleifera]|uniref:rho GTPase-activating protein REN1 isoform X2 n=1 Tax=Malania oleifera TaxID=397392 RepID=UPI0025ADD5BF|nr:rho GTPase-activating protein REN1 isoform X2 [Malania oleifera]